jgi:hypothetical protein
MTLSDAPEIEPRKGNADVTLARDSETDNGSGLEGQALSASQNLVQVSVSQIRDTP